MAEKLQPLIQSAHLAEEGIKAGKRSAFPQGTYV